MHSGIYNIINLMNGKRYVGSAKNIEYRLKSHLKSLRSGCGNAHLQLAWNKYGESNFGFAALMFCAIKDLLFYEQRVIDIYSSAEKDYGYNLSPTAGSPLGVKHTEATKKKMRLAHSGAKNGMFGKTHSKEVKERLRLARAKQIHPSLGKHRTPESRQKMSLARKKLYNSPDGDRLRAIISNSNRTRIESEETKAKRRARYYHDLWKARHRVVKNGTGYLKA